MGLRASTQVLKGHCVAEEAESTGGKKIGRVERDTRSVHRKAVGRNRKMKRTSSPEIECNVKWLTLSPNGEGGNALFANGKNRASLPGFVPTACSRRLLWEQGRSGGLRRSL